MRRDHGDDLTIGICQAPSKVRQSIWRAQIAAALGLGTDQIPVSSDAGILAERIVAAARAGDSAVRVHLALAGQDELAVARRLVSTLDTRNVEVQLRITVERPAPETENVLLLSNETSPIRLQNRLELLRAARAGERYRLVSRVLPLNIPVSVGTVWLRIAPAPVEDSRLPDGSVLLSDMPDLRAIIALCGEQAELPSILSREFLKLVFSTGMPPILMLGDNGVIRPCAPFQAARARALFVFPERMLPIRRAYYARAFDLISSLNYQGVSTDVLVFGPDNRDLARIQAALEVVAPRAFVVPLVRGHFSPLHWGVRWAERVLRKRHGIEHPPPMRFYERERIFASSAQQQHLERVIREHGPYEKVILTGAWFMKAAARLRARHPDIQWACDTHDVFFILDKDVNAGERRYFYSARREKARELKALNASDLVIAISQSDRDALAAESVAAPVVVDSGSFEHALVSPLRPGPAPSEFGFIGSGNSNNQRCLARIHQDWWPEIRRHCPDARLTIAGGICDTAIARAMAAEGRGSVVLAGFVADIKAFYAGIHALLAPIVVQGGLNFKSVEALMAGRHLITNPLGVRCIGTLPGVWVVNDEPGSLVATLDAVAGVDGPRISRVEIQAGARDRFGELAAFKDLAGWAGGALQREAVGNEGERWNRDIRARTQNETANIGAT